jgi:hypothetical protein
VIIDLVDTAPMPPGLLLADDRTSSDACNLLNVSISSARGKLVIVANVGYFEERAPGGEVAEILREATQAGFHARPAPGAYGAYLMMRSAESKLGPDTHDTRDRPETLECVDRVPFRLSASAARATLSVRPYAQNNLAGRCDAARSEERAARSRYRSRRDFGRAVLVSGPEYTDKAVEQQMQMLRNDPFQYNSYKALRRIYMEAHQYDKAWCVCSTLAFLKKADPDELQFYEQYKPRGLVKAKHAMSPDTWGKLIYPDENRYISAIFGASWQGVAAIKASPHKDFGIKRKDKRVLPGDPLIFSNLFYYVALVLNVPLPEVFLVEDNKAVDIQLANAIEKGKLCPSFVVRPHLLRGKSERELAFLSARRLTFMRPEYYLKMLLPTNTELKVVVLSAIVMVQPRFPVPPDMVQLVQQYLPAMQKRMPPQVLEQLGSVVARFIQAAPEINLTKWGHAVEATSHRAGFVVCGDLEVAARMVSAEPVTVDEPQVKDKIKELVLYSISDEYFTVRTQLGLTITG